LWAVVVPFGHGESPEIFILVARRQCFDVDRRRTGGEVEVADQIDVAPGEGRGAFEDLDGFQVASCQLLLVYPREEQSVVVDDRVGYQPGTFVPDLLLRFGLHAEFPGVDIGDRAPHPVVGLSAVERFLHVLSEAGIVDEVEDGDASEDVVQLPEPTSGSKASSASSPVGLIIRFSGLMAIDV
jgi:hypothetical protein